MRIPAYLKWFLVGIVLLEAGWVISKTNLTPGICLLLIGICFMGYLGYRYLIPDLEELFKKPETGKRGDI
jgi:hypothetical protein